MSEVYNLRIWRSVVGKYFPFDRIYLARHGEHDCFKQLFRYALIMPVEGALKEALIQFVTLDSFVDRTFDRSDGESASTRWPALIEEGSWVIAVPILTKYVKKAIPRYLVAEKWYTGPRHRRRAREAESPLPPLAYLQTPEKNIRPICVMCPRYILHQSGECLPGQSVCFEPGNLAVGTGDYFKDGLGAPDPSLNITDEEALTDVILSQD